MASVLRAVFAGAGVAMMGEAPVVNAVLDITGKPAADTVLLYLGTATYDLASFRSKQTVAFEERGVQVTTLDVANTTPSEASVAEAIDAADAILVSGGNTLFAVDRWKRTGMVKPLRRAMARGATLCGGSAGAGCWFDALHSDSMDPDSYREIMLAGGGAAAEAEEMEEGRVTKTWEYIRVPGLGFLPGLLCPHHDRTQSNGVLRSSDFAAMLRRHPGETGLAIDHYAALVISDARYRVLTLPDKPGSLTSGGMNQPGHGRPAAWLMTVSADAITIREHALPGSGLLAELLHPASSIVDDPLVEIARAENPSLDLAREPLDPNVS